MSHSNFYIRSGAQTIAKKYESAMVFIGIIGPFATLPQLIKLYFTHSQHAGGQSLITWSLYAVLSLIWLTYGLIEKQPAIYLGNGVSLVINLLMVAGIIYHSGLSY